MIISKFRSIFQQSRIIFLIFISLAILLISSALIELSQSKKDLYRLMEEESHTLLESLIKASQNSLLANQYLENLSRERFLNNANMINEFYNRGVLSNGLLTKLCRKNNIESIYVFNKQHHEIFFGKKSSYHGKEDVKFLKQLVEPVFENKTDTLILGPKKTRANSNFAYIVALSAKNKGVVVLNIKAHPLQVFRKEVGFGPLIRDVAAANPHIIYIALQNEYNILAATGMVNELEPIANSKFLIRSLQDSVFLSRIVTFDTLEVFEAVHPYTFNTQSLGLLRLGLSVEPLNAINKRIYRRMVMITILLLVIGFFMFTFIFIRQRLELIQKRYKVVETYSGNIIENVSDCIIVFDEENKIQIFNHAAEELFNVKKESIDKNGIIALFDNSDFKKIIENQAAFFQMKSRINGYLKFLFVSKSSFFDSGNKKYFILVIRDLTDQKLMEEQIERKERLTAMGELASGVAHEIRNPLNAISTIVQQIKKDFEPKQYAGEYHELIDIVYGEVKRINETIHDFLRFARPEPIHPSRFKIADLVEELRLQYQPLMQEHKINFELNLQWEGWVQWDKNQIKQVLINILQNAIDAIDQSGKISLRIDVPNNKELLIKITDDGPGMDESVKNNIFNLYFTTKAKGTGIGLSIVQRIIFEHGGVISVESHPQQGSSFIIRLPIIVSSPKQ